MDTGIISKQFGHRSIVTVANTLDHIFPWAMVDSVMPLRLIDEHCVRLRLLCKLPPSGYRHDDLVEDRV